MTDDKNIHAGHRERMIEKLLESSGALCDHELLEVMLFSFLPRVDTNAIAHNLLVSFGNLDNLFNAKSEDLMSVKGIGKNTASRIILIGKILKRINESKNSLSKLPINCFDDYEKEAKKLFKGITKERFVIMMLDVKHIPITNIIFDGENIYDVSANVDDILHSLVLNKPSYLILCHNHPSGSLEPSRDDDLATTKFVMLCQLHDITILDHLIIADNKVYSYHMSHKLADIKEKYKLETFLKNSEE